MPQVAEGGYFEDFAVGEVYRHPLGRTITDTDNSWFTLLTHNTNQMHFNAEYAARSAYGRILVNSGFTITLVLGLSVSDISQHAIANLGWDQVRLPHPVFVGDTIHAESRVVAARRSESRPHAGVVTFQTRGLNQDGQTVIHYVRAVLVHGRDSTVDRDTMAAAVDPWPEV